ncbi:hypothetical protein OFC04_26340, partial [Escherichia coli]|nr:hypothetical protein [Escherichia coli]
MSGNAEFEDQSVRHLASIIRQGHDALLTARDGQPRCGSPMKICGVRSSVPLAVWRSQATRPS